MPCDCATAVGQSYIPSRSCKAAADSGFFCVVDFSCFSIFSRRFCDDVLALAIPGLSFKELATLMLKRQQARARAARINAHAPIITEWRRKGQEMFAATRAIGVVTLALAIRFIVGWQMSADGVQQVVLRIAYLIQNERRYL